MPTDDFWEFDDLKDDDIPEYVKHLLEKGSYTDKQKKYIYQIPWKETTCPEIEIERAKEILHWRIFLVPKNDTQRNFLLFFCLSRFEYRVRHIYILDAKNIYIIRHALECTFGMGQCVFSDCISVRLKRMDERCHCVDITPIYFPLVWQERSSYRLMNGGSI